MFVKLTVTLFLTIGLVPLIKSDDCVPRDFGYGSVVCVCNSTYCDSKSENVPLVGQYRIYESSQSGKRMSDELGNFNDPKNGVKMGNEMTIEIHSDVKYQRIHGFGGAFTDAAGINIRKLSDKTQDVLIESYFGASGSRYNLGRVPVGGTDFSTRRYTLDDHPGDNDLSQFELAPEDFLYKIPIMKKARLLSPELRFVSAAWTAPPWMKTNDKDTGFGFLSIPYYQIYANYLVKFLDAYKNQGLQIWAISTGNEPADAAIPAIMFNTMGWTPMTMAAWVADNLGPTIAKSMSNDTMIFVLDDQRYYLPSYVVDVFANLKAKNYTAGIAVHWYGDLFIGPEVIDVTHDLYPDKFLILTEACIGSMPWDEPKVRLGDWQRAEAYMEGMMVNLGHWMTGFIDWNLALDKEGGPNWAGNFVDSPIIVNPETDEFFKQPMYYAMAHFSKFIPIGSSRIKQVTSSQIPSLAFSTPDDNIVVVLLNKENDDKTILVNDPNRGNITTKIAAHSIQTIVYKM